MMIGSRSTCYLVEPKWLNIQTISGRILAKILAEINADGPIDVGRMQDFLKTTSNGRSFMKHCIDKLNKNLKTLSSLQMNVCPCFSSQFKRKRGKIRSRLKHSEKESALTELRNELKEIRKLRNSSTLSLSSYSN